MADKNRKSRGFLSRLLHDRRGNTLAMAGAALVPIAGMIGSGLDMARAYMAEAKLQNACDAGALAARRTMEGASFTNEVEEEGERFFDFNFPASTMSAENVTRTVAQDDDTETTVVVTASADIPTTIMSLFGKDTIPITVTCNADNDYGNNDIMVVLDVTGSMNCAPGVSGGCGSEQPGSKASRLRAGAQGLYNALAGASNTRTRYGFMPYSVTVNVGSDLRDIDIRNPTKYWKPAHCISYWWIFCQEWAPADWQDVSVGDIATWRASSLACIEERPTIGNTAWPIRISQTVGQNDIDAVASSASDTARQWGRYDDPENTAGSGVCPAKASRLAEYNSLSSYNSRVNAATSTINGNTYHDIGIMWAARYLSSTGMFASSNPETYNDIPVSKHIVFMTDGELETSLNVYSAYGVEHSNYSDQRLQGSSNINTRHRTYFLAACNRAKTMGMTIWVVALDVGAVDEIEPCATSSGHFFTSDGSDLEDVFATIGQGIGRLRLTE